MIGEDEVEPFGADVGEPNLSKAEAIREYEHLFWPRNRDEPMRVGVIASMKDGLAHYIYREVSIFSAQGLQRAGDGACDVRHLTSSILRFRSVR